MKTVAQLPHICLAMSISSLLIGYLVRGYWWIVPALLILIILWLLTRSSSAAWPASFLLLSHVFLAVIGVTLNVSAYLMILGCTGALAYWDLTNFEQSLVHQSQSEHDSLLARHHLQALALATLVSLFTTVISLNLDLQFSFGVTLILVVMVMTGLTYGLHYVSKRTR